MAENSGIADWPWNNGMLSEEEDETKAVAKKVGINEMLNSMRKGSYEQDLKKPMKFTNVSPFYKGGMHGLIVGMTGSAKTTLLLTMLSTFIDRGHTILARDDGGLESLYLLPKVPIRIWIPIGCELTLKSPYKYEVMTFDWRHPEEILDRVYEYQFNLVVFDAYCIDPSLSAQFYSNLFRQLIFKSMQTPEDDRRKLIFSIDELNDLVQGRGGELTKDHAAVKALFNYNLRKLRKHKVTMVATSHRFSNIGAEPLTNFSYVFVKRIKGFDACKYLSESLTVRNANIYWATAKDLSRLKVNELYTFDDKGNYDKYYFDDIIREKCNPKAKGVIHSDTEKVDMKDPNYKRKIRVACLASKGLKSPKIAEQLGVSANTVRQDIMIMRREWGIEELGADEK